MFAILKQLASREIEIVGVGVVEVLQDGFRLPALGRCQLSRRPRRHLTSRPRRSAASACAPAIRWKG